MKSLPILIFAGVGFALPLMLSAAAQPGTAPSEPKALASCQKCHGPAGDSTSPIYPRLNGQQADYIVAQLKAFREHRRDDTRARGYMWVVAHGIDDKTIGDLARYFASQKPTTPQTGGELAAEGEKLYMNGDPAHGIQPCQQCHGKTGEGTGSVPRIAGQHAPYLRMVLGGFRSGLRKNQLMQPETKNMSDRQIEALSSYLTND